MEARTIIIMAFAAFSALNLVTFGIGLGMVVSGINLMRKWKKGGKENAGS